MFYIHSLLNIDKTLRNLLSWAFYLTLYCYGHVYRQFTYMRISETRPKYDIDY